MLHQTIQIHPSKYSLYTERPTIKLLQRLLGLFSRFDSIKVQKDKHEWSHVTFILKPQASTAARTSPCTCPVRNQPKRRLLMKQLCTSDTHNGVKGQVQRPSQVSTLTSTQISVSPGGQEHFQRVEAFSTLLTFTIHLLRRHCGDLNSGIFRNVAPTMENMEEKEMRVHRISPFLSSKSGSECFLPMSAMDRTKGMRLLSFRSFW